MNISDLIKQHENIQTMLDRRTRLLEDLQVLDEELAEAFAEIREGDDAAVPQRALPPAAADPGGAKGKRTKEATHPGPRAAARIARKKSAKRRGGRPGNVRGPVLEWINKRPGKTLTTEVIVDGTGLGKKQVQNALTHLCQSGEVKRMGRGEYRSQ